MIILGFFSPEVVSMLAGVGLPMLVDKASFWTCAKGVPKSRNLY